MTPAKKLLIPVLILLTTSCNKVRDFLDVNKDDEQKEEVTSYNTPIRAVDTVNRIGLILFNHSSSPQPAAEWYLFSDIVFAIPAKGHESAVLDINLGDITTSWCLGRWFGRNYLRCIAPELLIDSNNIQLAATSADYYLLDVNPKLYEKPVFEVWSDVTGKLIQTIYLARNGRIDVGKNDVVATQRKISMKTLIKTYQDALLPQHLALNKFDLIGGRKSYVHYPK